MLYLWLLNSEKPSSFFFYYYFIHSAIVNLYFTLAFSPSFVEVAFFFNLLHTYFCVCWFWCFKNKGWIKKKQLKLVLLCFIRITLFIDGLARSVLSHLLSLKPLSYERKKEMKKFIILTEGEVCMYASDLCRTSPL